MSVRLVLTDSDWESIESVIQQNKSQRGRPGLTDRLFVEAILYVARTGIPWRDLPDDFGQWQAVYKRFRRWGANGLWEVVWAELQKAPLGVGEAVFIDSSSIRAHQHAAGAEKKTVDHPLKRWAEAEVAMRTKIHLGCLDETRAISIVLTPGQTHDAKGFIEVFDGLPQGHRLGAGVMDKGYDSDTIRQQLIDHQIQAVIPPKSNRTVPIDYDKELYKERNKVERFFGRIKQFRRIATRYDKLAATFLAFIHVVAAYISIS